VQEGQQQQQQQQAQQSQQEQEQKQEGQQQQQQQKEQQPLGKQEPEQEGQQQQEVQQREEEEDGSEAEGGKEEEAAEQALLALPGTTTCKAASVCITLPGTYAYMAPDVYDMATCRRGMTEAQAIIAASQLAKDPACDIWSLGAVVMEMIVRPATPDSKMEPGNASVGGSAVPSHLPTASELAVPGQTGSDCGF
jgi:serine/threonine protein kinase